MSLIKTAVCTFTAALTCLSMKAQQPGVTIIDGKFPGDRPVPPVNRWILSFNPLSLMEPPMAIGLGVGYRLNPKVELWSETSFLTGSNFSSDGPLTGVRQILQMKYFIEKHRGFFVAGEVRYKSYQYRDKLNFVNQDTHDTLFNFSHFSRHYYWGIGFQVGWRRNLSANGRFQLELTTGLGLRLGKVDRQDVPPGYKYEDLYPPKDMRIEDLNKGFLPYYLPGSIRLIYLFGKRLRP